MELHSSAQSTCILVGLQGEILLPIHPTSTVSIHRTQYSILCTGSRPQQRKEILGNASAVIRWKSRLWRAREGCARSCSLRRYLRFLDMFLQSGVIYEHVPYLGWGLIRNPQVAKKSQFIVFDTVYEAISSTFHRPKR